jgi:hypothetical protein
MKIYIVLENDTPRVAYFSEHEAMKCIDDQPHLVQVYRDVVAVNIKDEYEEEDSEYFYYTGKAYK